MRVMRNIPNRLMMLLLAVLLSSFLSLRSAQAEDKILTGTSLTSAGSFAIKEINQTASTIVTVAGQMPPGEKINAIAARPNQLNNHRLHVRLAFDRHYQRKVQCGQ